MAFPSRGYKIIIDNPKNAVFTKNPINWDLRWSEWNHGQVLTDTSKSRGLLATFANSIARVQGYVKSVEYVEHNGNEQSQITLTNVYLLLHEGKEDESVVFYQHINVYVPVEMRTFYVHINQQVYFSGKITKYHRSASAVTHGATELAFSIGMPVEAIHYGQYRRLESDCLKRNVIRARQKVEKGDFQSGRHGELHQETGRHRASEQHSNDSQQKSQSVGSTQNSASSASNSSAQGLYQETGHHKAVTKNSYKSTQSRKASTSKGSKVVNGIRDVIDIGIGIYGRMHGR